jgi:hypothetical protein
MHSWTERGLVKHCVYFPQNLVLFVLILSFFQMSEDEGDDSLTNEDESNEDESNEDESNEVIFTDVSPFKIIVYL